MAMMPNCAMVENARLADVLRDSFRSSDFLAELAVMNLPCWHCKVATMAFRK